MTEYLTGCVYLDLYVGRKKMENVDIDLVEEEERR